MKFRYYLLTLYIPLINCFIFYKLKAIVFLVRQPEAINTDKFKKRVCWYGPVT